MEETLFADLPGRTQERLRALADAVAGVVPRDVRSWRIDVASLPEDPGRLPALAEARAWAGRRPVIYYLDCSAASCDLAGIRAALQTARDSRPGERAYPRVNAPGPCFYVGSSRAIAGRLKDHLGYGPRGTYALHLVHWARPLGLALDLVCAAYAQDTPAEVLQALEDMLWELRRPMFGRRGQK